MAMTDQAEISSSMATPSPGPTPGTPSTLAIDVGATGLKASVLDADGAMVADRVKIATTYPMSPQKLIDDLSRLVAPLPDDRTGLGRLSRHGQGRLRAVPVALQHQAWAGEQRRS